MQNNDNSNEDNLEEDRLALSIEEEKEAAERSLTDWFVMATNAYVHEAYYEAIAYFTKVIDLDAYNARAYVNRGDVYADLEAYDEAFSDYSMAIHFGSHQAYEIAQELLDEIVANHHLTATDRARIEKLLNLENTLK